MKTTIVCGVLGAGKTSFLKNILKHGNEKTVVLVNDFGSAGIDGEILSAGGIESIELPSGCVCCTLKFDLITTIQKILDTRHPDHLFIEPSGVASPSGVLEALGILKVHPVSVICIVDASEFLDDYEAEIYGWFFKSQVTRADIVLVNKTDLADKLKTEKTIHLIGTLNPYAVVIPAVNAEVDRALLKHEAKPGGEITGLEHNLKIETLTLTLDTPASPEIVTRFFKALADGTYGNVIRAKALVQTDKGPSRFDLASKQVAVEPFEHEIRDSRIVIIGTELDREKISAIQNNPTHFNSSST